MDRGGNKPGLNSSSTVSPHGDIFYVSLFLPVLLEYETMILITRDLELCLCVHAQNVEAQNQMSSSIGPSLLPLHLFFNLFLYG